MLRVQASRMVWMLCFLYLSCEPDGAASTGGGNSGKNSLEVMFMCNNTLYNPAKATCCGGKNLTGGLSENMSQCCGLEAFNPLNEICCNSTVHAKLSQNTSCCGKKSFDKNEQLCCGNENKVVMTRLSSDHRCCVNDQYKSQYNKKLECCCEKKNPMVQLKVNGTVNEKDCCVKDFKGNLSSPIIQSTDDERKPGYFKNPNGTNETNCTNGDRTETYTEKTGFKCCGHYYYNTSLWLCCKDRLIPFYKHNWFFTFAGFDICVYKV